MSPARPNEVKAKNLKVKKIKDIPVTGLRGL
jgi:hypothetical protein